MDSRREWKNDPKTLDTSSNDEYSAISAGIFPHSENPEISLEENMGRTVMPFSFVLEKEHERWKEFRKALSKDDKETFDRLFDRAKFHTHAAVYMAHPWPMETILLSIILEHEKMLGEMLRKLNDREPQGPS